MSIRFRDQAVDRLGLNCLGRAFGWQRMLDAEVFLPTPQYFPDRYEGEEEDIAGMLGRLCKYLDINAGNIGVQLFQSARRRTRFRVLAVPNSELSVRRSFRSLASRAADSICQWRSTNRRDQLLATPCHLQKIWGVMCLRLLSSRNVC